jgi:hypothetical protein
MSTMTRGRLPQSLAAILEDRIDARPARVRDVAMRSQLEARFARHLDALEVPWQYEPRVFGSPGHRYLPDFLVVMDGRRTYFEVKPTVAEAPAARAKMSVIWQEDRDAVLVVACAEGSTFWAARSGDVEWLRFRDLWKSA